MANIDLKNEDMSYFFGFALADGHLSESSRNRGRLSIEINSKDEDVLLKFQDCIPYNSSLTERIRNTNFGKNVSSVFCVHSLEFRNKLKEWGFPVGKKSDILTVPKSEYDEIAFFRGFIDGDGSIAISANNKALVSVVVSSEDMKEAYCNFLFKHLGIVKNISRNKRDNVYNITITNEDAVALVKLLDYENCEYFLERKKQKALEVLSWVRDCKKKDFTVTYWSDEQDKILLENSDEDAAKILNRTLKSVKTRRWRLSKTK